MVFSKGKLTVFFLWLAIVMLSCNESGSDCSIETANDKKINEKLQLACLADPQDPNYCRLYLLQSVYRPHCW